MGTPRLRLVRDPRAQFWGSFTGYGLPNSVGLNWEDLPDEGDHVSSHEMAGILWTAFSALGLTGVVFTHPLHEVAGPSYRRLTSELVMAEGEAAFLAALDFEDLDSWQGDQCYLALPGGQLPKRSDAELAAWQPFWAPRWKHRKQPTPTRMPEHVPLLLKVHDGEDAAWAVAFADSAGTRDRFEAAVAEAARAAGVKVSRITEDELLSPSLNG